ncbi:type II toxin-antitoxin system YafQ family toxin [Ruminococcus sp.]|uniref:type II toxin-antitoxin system YafQ family toxin n=1 Tax=Ruminococcus sp. TaxID=41978 RepID=UPI003FD6C3B8
MLKITYHNKFKKDFKKAKSRGLDMSRLNKVITMLAEEQSLPAKYREHSLTGNYKDFLECHIEPDWLLIYERRSDELILLLYRTGTHSDLF